MALWIGMSTRRKVEARKQYGRVCWNSLVLLGMLSQPRAHTVALFFRKDFGYAPKTNRAPKGMSDTGKSRMRGG